MLYVPKGTVDKYKITYHWYEFAHVEEGYPLANTDYMLISL